MYNKVTSLRITYVIIKAIRTKKSILLSKYLKALIFYLLIMSHVDTLFNIASKQNTRRLSTLIHEKHKTVNKFLIS